MKCIVANAEHLDTILKMLKESAQFLNSKNVDQWSYWLNPPEEKVIWLKEGLVNNEFYFIHNTEGTHMGMFRLLYEDQLYWGKQKEQAGYVHSLVVKNEFKGQNLGKKIMTQIEQDLVSRKINLLRLDCVANNEELCSYYTRLGFKKVGQVKMPLSLNNLYEKQLK